MSNIHVYRSAAIAGANNAARKSRVEQAYDRGAASAKSTAMYRDNFVNRVKQDGGLGGSKLVRPPAPAPELFLDPSTREDYIQASEARERATLDAISALATAQLGDAACAAEGERITGTPASQAAAAVAVARAQLDAAQVAEAVAQHQAHAAQRAMQREVAARKQAEQAPPSPPAPRDAAAPGTFTSFLKKLAGLAAESASAR